MRGAWAPQYGEASQGVLAYRPNEDVADPASNRLQRDGFARSETGRTRCPRRPDARDGIGQRPVMATVSGVAAGNR